VLFVTLVAGVFGLLPQLGGLARDAAGLRHGRPGFMVAAVVAQAVSLGCYALLYRQVLAALGARLRFRLAVDVVLASLDLMFVAFGYQPGFGPLAVAYTAANIASAIPLTPGGLGVVEVTLVAISVGFGSPRPTAVLAVLGYRVVNYWLPLIPGAVAYLRLRLKPGDKNSSERAGSTS
jgi:uncharacterized membrane protein YbhN (UPF0104 family)